MSTETIAKTLNERLSPMVGKIYLYGRQEHTIKKINIDTDRERVEVQTNLRDYDRPFESILTFMAMFKEVGSVAVAPGGNIHKLSDAKNKMSDVLVYQTNNYARFKNITGNRKLNQRKIRNIIKDINAGIDVLKYYPIVVREKNDHFEIVDGQHRFSIAQQLKKPVHYIILQLNMDLPDIAKVNSNTEKWKTTDFINCYIEQGNTHYKTLLKFLTEYDFNISTSIYLLSKGHPGREGGIIDQSFQRGEFEVKFLDEATHIAEQVKLFEDFPGWQDRAFVIAVHRIMQAGHITIQEIAEKYKEYPDKLTKQLTYKEYLVNLENLVNHKKSIRKTIY